MVLNACIDLLITTIGSMLKFFIENWFMVIIALGAISIIVRSVGPIMIGLLASLMNLAIDFLFGVSVGISTPLSLTLGIVIGFLWSSLILSSPVNSILKFINMPFMFLIGLTWGFLPLPIPVPLAFILGFLMKYKTTNYLIAITPSIIIILFLALAGPTNICSGMNWLVF